MKYPDKGELFLASKKEDQPSEALVFFVHFFNGHKKALKRHVEFVNELGYDAYIFNIKDSPKEYKFIPWSRENKKFGLKHVMSAQIEQHYDQFPQYKKKIIYAFSNVSVSAIEMMAKKFKEDKAHYSKEFLGLICDSGPGVALAKSSYNLLKHEFKMGLAARYFSTPIFTLLWGKNHTKDLAKDLDVFPKNFPILTLRGWRDKLISPKYIDQVFAKHKQLRVHKVDLPEAGHINGLRDFPSEYKPPVQFFIDEL